MTKQKKRWSPQKRKAYNRRRKTQRMRKEKRYQAAQLAVERYIGDYLNELLVPHTTNRTHTQIFFNIDPHCYARAVEYLRIKPPRRPYYGSCARALLLALNYKLRDRKVRLHMGETLGHRIVFTTTSYTESYYQMDAQAMELVKHLKL